MQLRRRTAAAITLLPVPFIPVAFYMWVGSDRYLVATFVGQCLLYLGAFWLFLGDRRSIGTFLLMSAFVLVGLLLIAIGAILVAFSHFDNGGF